MSTVFRKWWVILLQGILLIIISFIFFNNPVEVLTVISFWVGLLILTAGALGLIGYLLLGKEERENSVLWWSLATLVFGILSVSKLGLTMKVITVLFGIWILIVGFWLFTAGWEHRKSGGSGWLMLLAGIFSIASGIAVIFDLATGAVWISTLLGIQALLAGLGLIILALIKRKLVKKIKADTAFTMH
ncbi:MAG TPA: DUF308 domain-containing protein [Chitinophagaceae bacterium]